MNLSAILTVFRKEVLDIIRDRRTLIFMVIMPLLLIPGIFYLMSKFQISSREKMALQVSKVAIIGSDYAPALTDFLQNEEKNRVTIESDPTLNGFLAEQQSGLNAFMAIEADTISPDEIETSLRNNQYGAILKVPAGFESDIAAKISREEGVTDFKSGLMLEIHYLSTDDHSEKAYNRLRKSLNYYKEQIVESRLKGEGYSKTLIEPYENIQRDHATTRERSGEIFGALLPYLIILMTFAGATFPAIQLGAGEKEQKTLETLLVSPVGRAEIVTGKFLTIMLTGIISAALSMTGLYIAFTQMGPSGGASELLNMQFDLMTLVFSFILVIPLTLVFAALLLSLSVFARSYREAQSYVGPLNMFIIVPAFASLLPGVELNMWLAMTPVVNVSLVLRKVLSGKLAEVAPYYIITIVSTLVIAIIAIFVCAWMFKREEAIFKD